MKWRKYSPELKKIGCVLLAALFVYVLHCKIQVFDVTEPHANIDDFVRNLSVSFQSVNLADIFVWGAAYFMIRYVSARDNAVDWSTAVLAVIFSVSYVVSSSYYALNSGAFLNANWYQYILSGICIFGFSFLFYYCIRTIFIYVETHTSAIVQGHAAKALGDRLLLVSFLVIATCWLPWILMNYPGTFCFDSIWQLRQFFGDTPVTGHHPPLSTYIMGVFAIIGDFYADMNFGAFLYILFQTCVGAWVFSVGIVKLHEAGIRLRYCLLMVIFYALAPFWGCFAQWYEKDLLYAEAATMFLIILIDIMAKRECTQRDAWGLTLVGVVASLLRNNGIYAVVPAVFLLGFYVAKHFRKTVFLSLSGILLTYLCIVKIIYPSALGIENGSVREALSIPFQQTARYVVEYGDEVTEYEKAAIDGVLDYSLLSESYNPILSDPIKGMYKEDAAMLPDYYKAWFEMFWKHPDSYIAALLNGSYGYMAPVLPDIEANIWTDFSGWTYLDQLGIHRIFDELPTSIFVSIRNIGLNAPLIRYMSMPGLYTWIVMLCGVYMLKKKVYGPLILLVPEFANILVCIASPLSNAIRYELPVVASVPLLIGWALLFAYRRDCSALVQETNKTPCKQPNRTVLHKHTRPYETSVRYPGKPISPSNYHLADGQVMDKEGLLRNSCYDKHGRKAFGT